VSCPDAVHQYSSIQHRADSLKKPFSTSALTLTRPPAAGVSKLVNSGGVVQMFVIKNLDTGTHMRIDEFDRIAHIAADPDPANQVSSCSPSAGSTAFLLSKES
jgi:hypothetical protein